MPYAVMPNLRGLTAGREVCRNVVGSRRRLTAGRVQISDEPARIPRNPLSLPASAGNRQYHASSAVTSQ